MFTQCSQNPTVGYADRKIGPHYKYLHCFHIFTLLFSLIFIFFSIFHPHLTSHPPPLAVISPSIPSSLPLPPSSICQCLDISKLVLLHQHSTCKKPFYFSRRATFFFYLLLLLSGDVEPNPGPSNAFFTL